MIIEMKALFTILLLLAGMCFLAITNIGDDSQSTLFPKCHWKTIDGYIKKIIHILFGCLLINCIFVIWRVM